MRKVKYALALTLALTTVTAVAREFPGRQQFTAAKAVQELRISGLTQHAGKTLHVFLRFSPKRGS
jgi:hypothetical protein